MSLVPDILLRGLEVYSGTPERVGFLQKKSYKLPLRFCQKEAIMDEERL